MNGLIFLIVVTNEKAIIYLFLILMKITCIDVYDLSISLMVYIVLLVLLYISHHFPFDVQLYLFATTRPMWPRHALPSCIKLLIHMRLDGILSYITVRNSILDNTTCTDMMKFNVAWTCVIPAWTKRRSHGQAYYTNCNLRNLVLRHQIIGSNDSWRMIRFLQMIYNTTNQERSFLETKHFDFIGYVMFYLFSSELAFLLSVPNSQCELESFQRYNCLTSVTHAKCGIRSTLCWKTWNISGSTELSLIVILDYGLKLHKLSIHTLVMLQKWLEIH